MPGTWSCLCPSRRLIHSTAEEVPGSGRIAEKPCAIGIEGFPRPWEIGGKPVGSPWEVRLVAPAGVGLVELADQGRELELALAGIVLAETLELGV